MKTQTPNWSTVEGPTVPVWSYGLRWAQPLEDERNEDFVMREYKEHWFRGDDGQVFLGQKPINHAAKRTSL